jgi:hypothetical protein
MKNEKDETAAVGATVSFEVKLEVADESDLSSLIQKLHQQFDRNISKEMQV